MFADQHSSNNNNNNNHRRSHELRREEPQIRTHSNTTSSAGSFLYNSRVWLFFLPCLLVLLSLGGRITLGTVIVGVMIAYICDVRGSKEGTLAALWGTLLATEFGLVLSGAFLFQQSLVNIFLLFNVAVFLVVTGMWGSLQVKWVSEFQLLVVGMERCIFAIISYPAAVLMTWAAIASQGIDNAPYYMLFFLGAGFYSFGLPTKSSFRGKDARAYILGKLETCVLSITFVVLPAIVYTAIYHSVLSRSLLHLTNIILLVTLPLLVISFLTDKGSLWWIAPNYYASKQPTTEAEVYLERAGRTLRTIIMMVVVGCLEHKFVFHSPSLYHALALFPPWSYIIVTVALYSFVALAFYLRYASSMKKARPLLLGLGTLSGFCAGLVVGAPIYIYPFILLVVHSLVAFYFSRKFLSYLVFVASSVVCLSWFVTKTYAYISYTFGGLPMSFVAVLIVVQFTLTLLVPGLMAVAYDNLPGLAGMVLFLHTISVAVLEHILYSQDTEIYPYYLVIATSITGACVFYKLHQMKKVTLVWRWLGTSLYVAKLAIALTTVDYAVVYSFFLLLSISVLYVMPTPKTASAQGNLNSMVTGIIGVTGCMIFLTRNTILAKLIFLFTQQQLTPLATFASFLVAWGLSITPLSFRFFANKPLVRAGNSALIVCGSLLYLVSAGAITNSRAQVQAQGTSWANWFLLAGLVPLVFVLTSLINLNRVKPLRLIMPVFIGIFLGLYISGRFIPIPPPRTVYSTSTPLVVIVQHLLHGMVLACVGVFLSVTQWPSPLSSNQPLWVYSTFISLFPVLYAMANQVFIFAPVLVRTESVMVSRVVLVGLYAALNFLISLFLKLKVSNVKFNPGNDRRPRGEAPPRRTHNIQPTDFNATIGNFATISTFLLSIYLQIGYLGGSELAILVLAPVLLLLNRDSRLLRHLNESNRYFPIVFTISSVLIGYSFKRLIFPSLIPSYISLWWWTSKNAFLLLLTLPSHYLLNNFLWDAAHASRNSLLWIVSTILNALPLLFADLQGVQYLAILGAGGWVMQYFEGVARRNKSKGQVL